MQDNITAHNNYRAWPKQSFLNSESFYALAESRHADPYSILGLHVCQNGYVIRVFDQSADRVELISSEFGTLEMHACNDKGLFVYFIEADSPFKYQLRKYYNGHATSTFDTYSFLPSINDYDLHLIAQADHRELYNILGSHSITHAGIKGIRFTVWAPNASAVSLIGNFNSWNTSRNLMRSLGSSGIWEIFIPELAEGEFYKYSIRDQFGVTTEKQDPLARSFQMRPGTASIAAAPQRFSWDDDKWLEERRQTNHLGKPVSIYEVHLGSWGGIENPEEGTFSNYRELAHKLADYVNYMGFTHVELLPITEHPFDQSWGYQTTGYFAPTSRHGTPEDFAYFVNHMHNNNIGVIVDWAPAHFPKDKFSLGKYDGTSLYEHADPRMGEHLDWGTYIFSYGRNEVDNFLIASALYWLDIFHIDGLRVDAVSSMLYRDYSREEWVPNIYGGNENLEAISLIRRLNTLCHERHPGAMIIAEESTAYPGVSHPIYNGGLGFTMKWNMGWMHDFLNYFSENSAYRKYHQNQLTFALSYAFNENFILPLSHDEVVHGKGSLIQKMPGDEWQQFANLRALYGSMFAHPGKKLLFMGAEIAQWAEWNCTKYLDWATLDSPNHKGIQNLIRDLNHFYQKSPAFHECETDSNFFQWIDFNDHDQSVISFIRWDAQKSKPVIAVCNFTPVVRHNYKIGAPFKGKWIETFNTDSAIYGGSDVRNHGPITARKESRNNLPASIELSLPPLSVIFLELDK